MSLGKDKYMHFSACAVITIVTMVLFFLFNCNFIIAALAGICTSTAAAWGKEYGDKNNPNNKWDWHDIIADSLGTLFGIILSSIIWLCV